MYAHGQAACLCELFEFLLFETSNNRWTQYVSYSRTHLIKHNACTTQKHTWHIHKPIGIYKNTSNTSMHTQTTHTRTHLHTDNHVYMSCMYILKTKIHKSCFSQASSPLPSPLSNQKPILLYCMLPVVVTAMLQCYNATACQALHGLYAAARAEQAAL